jgi:hypothetical protein
MNKHEVIVRLRRDLQAAMVERQLAATDAATARARESLRRFQSARMSITHADLLASNETRDAAQFFLDDLYGTHDFTQRDADIERIIPMMESLMPISALQTIAEAIELDALSEALDRAMAVRLGEQFVEADYIDAYCKITSRTEREAQITHIQSVGGSLCELVRIPLIGGTLAMMRVPAKLAGLGELHNFLDRGFGAFKKMRKPKDFVTAIVKRETTILENLYTQKPQPFDLGDSQAT